MRQADIDFIIQQVTKKLNADFRAICETRINHSLHNFIVRTIKEIICDSKEFKPILDECFSNEAQRIVNEEMEKVSIPLTVSQLATLTGLSEMAIYQRRHRGQLNFEKKGSRIFISLRELNSQLLNIPNQKG